MRISKEIRDILADAVEGFKTGLRPVFNQWGDGCETGCLITSANVVRQCKISYTRTQKDLGGDLANLPLGWDSAYGNWDDPIYKSARRLGAAMLKSFVKKYPL